MKIRIILTAVLIAVQLALAFLPLIPDVKDKLPYPSNPNPREQLDWQIVFIGVEFALMSACVAILILTQQIDTNQSAEENKNQLKELRQSLTGLRVRQVPAHEFYDDFLHAVRKAQHTVMIMYLAPVAPDYAKDPQKKRYYDDLVKAIKDNPKVHYQRIMRDSKYANSWTVTLMNELKDAPNADIAVLKGDATADMPIALSTQIVDCERVWFVALEAHDSRGVFRDLFIDDATVALSMTSYYKRIWARSEAVMINGQITDAGNRFMKRVADQNAK